MSGYTVASREDDPIHTVRTIGRLSHMLVELRDEYVARPRPETLGQIEQRLDDLLALREELRTRAHSDHSNDPGS